MRYLDSTVVLVGATTILLVAAIASTPATGSSEGDVTAGAYWKYKAEVEISSLNLDGKVTITYRGEVEKEVEGTTYLMDLYEWRGSLDISGLYSAGIANGTAKYRGEQYVSTDTGYDVLTDTNMSLNFTTCYGSLDQKTHHLWHHCTTSFLPPGGVGDEPSDKELGTNWTKTYSVHMRSRGTFWSGEFIDFNLTENRTYEYCVDSIDSVSVPAGGFDCTEIRCSCENDVLVEWRSEKVRHPAMMQIEYYDVTVYHSSEEWTMTLTSYDLNPSDLSAVLVGAAAAVCVAAIAIFFRRRRKGR